MKRTHASASPLLAVFMVALSSLVPGAGRAQGTTRTAMPTGPVTGLELALDGATSGPVGSDLRWFFTLYEVVGHDALRPARGGRLRVLASDRPNEVIGDLRTDRHGRAQVAIPIGRSWSDFNVVVEASSARVGRTFTLSVSPTSEGAISLVADRSRVQPGERVNLVGRVTALPSGRPMAGERVSLAIMDHDGRSLAPREEIITGAGGAFAATFEVSTGVGSVRFTVDRAGSASASVSVAVAERDVPRMIVRAVPGRRLVAPDDLVPVEVMVRRPDGRPVRRARITIDGVTPGPDAPEILTDPAGRAEIRWRAPGAVGRPPIADVDVRVSASRDGLGTEEAVFSVRVARERLQVGVGVEGGALLAGLPSRIFVRVVGADGEPASDVPIRLESPILGQLTATTDPSGVAILESRPEVRIGIEGHDRCGGTTATAAVLSVGQGHEELRLERCLPVDPDGRTRVRPIEAILEAGAAAEAELHLSDEAESAPVEVVALWRQDEGRLVPVARTVVEPRNRRVSLELPAEVVGEVLLRARPLIGAALEPVLGGTAAIWVTPGARVASRVHHVAGRAEIELEARREGTQATALVVPADEADELVLRLRRSVDSTFAVVLDDPSRASASLVEGWLSARTPRDDAAPAVLRGREVVVVPAPEEPTSFGVLRDPVRARARFVRGRLALVVRSLEQRLEEAIPDRVHDVGVQAGRGGWTFNREALEAVIGAHLLQRHPPMTLGGAPLVLADLESLDRSFTFDNMARRVTRRRMFDLLVQLRQLVDDNDLDLWQGQGDPALWLELLVEDQGLGRARLRDGWGRPMTIRRAPGGRARFRSLAPLPAGYELVSAGPDGRFGTGDDRSDPFARVLPSGSAYAEAVGEDELLIRLQRVEMGQATLAAIAAIFGVDTSLVEAGSAPTAARSWDDLPRPLVEVSEVDRFERSWLPLTLGHQPVVTLDREARLDLALDEEHRAYELVGLAWTREGWADVARTSLRAGFPAILTVEPVERLRLDEPLTVAVVVALLPGGPRRISLSLESDERLRTAVEGSGGDGGPIQLGPGDAAEARVSLVGVTEGRGRARISVVGPDGVGRSVELEPRVQRPGSLRSQDASAAAAHGPTSLRVEVPRDAVEPEGVVTLSRPRAFLSDPSLSRWLADDPALLAWAVAVSGQELPEGLVRRLEAATRRDGTVDGDVPLLSGACAAVAWASATAGTHWAASQTAEQIAASDGDGDLTLDAAVLAALSVAAGPDDGSALARRIEGNRDLLRAAVRSHRDDVSLMARAAAALLLSDWRDVRGRTMLALARRHLEAGFRGGDSQAVTVGDGHDDPPGRAGATQLVATAALAIAAHQAEDHELARRLARGLAARAHVATELGGEPLFWFLAARAFGVFGYADELAVTVEQGGGRREVVLTGETTTLPLELLRPGLRAEVRVSPSAGSAAMALVGTEVRYLRPAEARDDGPLRAVIDGDPGFAGERAAWVVSLTNSGRTAIDRPVLLVALPAGAALDATARSAVSSTEGVAVVDEPDERGVVRVRLAPMSAGEERRLPLPIRWTAAGRRRGLELSAFPQDRAWELSTTAPVEVDVPFRPDE